MSPNADERHQICLSTFNSHVAQFEPTIIAQLKDITKQVQHSPLLLLATLQRFANLLRRPSIKDALKLSMEQLARQIREMVQKTRDEETGDYECGPVRGSFKEAIIRSRQRKSKTQQLLQVCNVSSSFVSLV